MRYANFELISSWISPITYFSPALLLLHKQRTTTRSFFTRFKTVITASRILDYPARWCRSRLDTWVVSTVCIDSIIISLPLCLFRPRATIIPLVPVGVHQISVQTSDYSINRYSTIDDKPSVAVALHSFTHGRSCAYLHEPSWASLATLQCLYMRPPWFCSSLKRFSGSESDGTRIHS